MHAQEAGGGHVLALAVLHDRVEQRGLDQSQ